MTKAEQIEEMVNILLDADFFTQKELDTTRQYAEALYSAGYRKVEKPKLLSPEAIRQALEPHYGPNYPATSYDQYIAQAQRDADYLAMRGEE